MRFCIIDIIYNICHSQLFEFPNGSLSINYLTLNIEGA